MLMLSMSCAQLDDKNHKMMHTELCSFVCPFVVLFEGEDLHGQMGVFGFQRDDAAVGGAAVVSNVDLPGGVVATQAQKKRRGRPAGVLGDEVFRRKRCRSCF